MHTMTKVYTATLEPIPGISTSVLGTVAVFIDTANSASPVSFAGSAVGLSPNIGPEDCNGNNNCGAQLHSGLSCESVTTQRGHLFGPPLTTTPWRVAKWSSDENGVATFRGVIEAGQVDVEGRAFIVKSEGGGRLACGLLQEWKSDLYIAETTPLGESNVSSTTYVLPSLGGMDRACIYGKATGLETNLTSFLAGGADCSAVNGCGAHVHAGTACTDASAQGGHFYNIDLLAMDPWQFVGYESTDSFGNGIFVDCLETGEIEWEDKPFIVHANDGSRVSCGLLDLVSGSPVIEPNPVYAAFLEPIPGASRKVYGSVTVFLVNEQDTVAFAGSAVGLEESLEAADCSSNNNACGTQIHDGVSCFNATTQKGHFFRPPVTTTPWRPFKYTSDDDGVGIFSGVVNQGSVDIEGRVFVVKAQDGSRLACGVLQPISSDNMYTANTEALDGSGVSGTVTVATRAGGFDRVCMYGNATGLEPNLVSFLLGGSDCQSTNGCGAHIHAGMDCSSTEGQLGHFYNPSVVGEDPWLLVGYKSTDSEGFGHFIHCLATGESDYYDRAFIVHNEMGGRVSCANLIPPTAAPSSSPTMAPTPACPCKIWQLFCILRNLAECRPFDE